MRWKGRAPKHGARLLHTRNGECKVYATASALREGTLKESERRPSALPAQREGKCQPCGLLREAQSDPKCTGGKRQPCGLLREAQSAPERGSETMSTTEREVRMIEQPGLLGQRPKATRRREQIQGPGTASARNADICEGSETMSATGREARMIEQPGRPKGGPCEATQIGPECRKTIKPGRKGTA